MKQTASAISLWFHEAVMKVPRLKPLYEMLRDTILACADGQLITQGAALSYYTFFAIAPLFLIVLAIAGYCFGEEAAQHELFSEVSGMIGRNGSDAIQAIVIAASEPKTGVWATTIAITTLFIAATGAFIQLQNSLNQIWQVEQKKGFGVRSFIRHRLLSLAMVFGIGFLLLVSLTISAALSAFGNFMGHYISGQQIVMKLLNFAVSLGIITILFSMIFKFLPDVKVAWHNVWLGGFLTAILFNVGKFLFGLYIGHSSTISIYGAMGSLVIILLWVYYSSLILFFGAAFTRVYAQRGHSKPTPIRGAEFITGQSA
ncbi:MAG TPA: YihY/virulence factor BrkB family protein [Verrucomicrobiae bacterium]|jgi:membrane protein